MEKRKFIIRIKDLLTSPKATLCIGFLLVLAGVFELTETTLESTLGYEITSAHGILVFGFSQIFISITHVLEGIEDLGVAAEEQALKAEEERLKQQVDRSDQPA